MKFKKRLLFLTLLFLLASYKTIAAQDARFECGGRVEAEVWGSWDANVRDFLNQQQLHERLIKQGDVYALYDFQTYTHNMVSMARRCNRADRLLEVSRLVRTAYGALEKGTPSSPGRRWVCRGGSICNDKNRLLNQEVMLDSIQFLALACSLANALMSSDGPMGDEEKAFVGDTVQIVTEHLVRWGDKATITTLRKTAATTPRDVKDGSSALFFTAGKPLSMITIYAELAGIILAQERRSLGFISLTSENGERFRQHLGALLQFFSARISFRQNANSRLGNVDLADLDRGYWEL